MKNLKSATVYQRFQSTCKTMLLYCVKFRKKLKSNKILTKNQEENGLLSSLGFKTLLSEVPLLCNILF